MRMATDRIARHRFGPTGRTLGVIGQGTWYLETGNRASSIAALLAGIDLGMTPPSDDPLRALKSDQISMPARSAGLA